MINFKNNAVEISKDNIQKVEDRFNKIPKNNLSGFRFV